MIRDSWLLVTALAVFTTACLKRQEPPPLVDPGTNTHHSDQVGDDIDYGGQPDRVGGESAGGYSGGGSIAAPSQGAGAGQSIDEVEPGAGTSATAPSFSGTPGTGVVQLVRNDIVKGREQALAAALKDAVVKKSQADGIGSIPADLMAKFRKYVTRYKIIREGATDDGSYKLDLEADIDTTTIRADISARVGGGPVGQTLELHVANVRRARDLRAIANVLRGDGRVKEVRQQSYARNAAVLEVDTTAMAEEVAELVAQTMCEDGVTVTVDAVKDRSIKSTIVFPKTDTR